MNIVLLTGNLTGDPEGRTTQSGINCSQFRIAVQRNRKNASGTYDTDFFNVTAWRKTADFCNSFLKKGRKVAVAGTLQTRSYDAQDGSKRTVFEIVADTVEALTPAHATGDGRPGDAPATAPDDFTEVDDPELPF